jgi:hypothetical protein
MSQHSVGAVAQLAEARGGGRRAHNGDVEGCCVESRESPLCLKSDVERAAALSTDRETREKAAGHADRSTHHEVPQARKVQFGMYMAQNVKHLRKG